MLRKGGSASAMQKTYDECYLICSTAIFFEGQNNEKEALRSWRNALDQIYYHNAYKMPSNYTPRSETEKALHDSLRSMELQCKERVDLLDALRKSRLEAEEDAKGGKDAPSKSKESLGAANKPIANGEGANWLGGGSIPPANYADLPRPSPGPASRPSLPPRPSYVSRKSSGEDIPRSKSSLTPASANLIPPAGEKARARTPSPEKKSGGMLRTLRPNAKDRPSSGKVTTLRNRPPQAASQAASQVWTGPARPSSTADVRSSSNATSPTPIWESHTRSFVDRPSEPLSDHDRRISDSSVLRPPSPSDYQRPRPQRRQHSTENASFSPPPYPEYPTLTPAPRNPFAYSEEDDEASGRSKPPPPPPHKQQQQPPSPDRPKPLPNSIADAKPSSLSYMKEFPNHPPLKPKQRPPPPASRGHRTSDSDVPPKTESPKPSASKTSPAIPRKQVGRPSSGPAGRARQDSSPDPTPAKPIKRKAAVKPIAEGAPTPPSTDSSHSGSPPSTPTAEQEWDKKVKHLLKHLPRGVDETAAKQILNDIVIHGDEVHWDDVAGLEIAKSALKETVVYPFLRPDLFMGLREPARGMLLFGPPGTGKTMLARAVATESKSVFFAISASSLTSKYLGESEKLVRALFALAKALAPSIIFVDEIDSLLGSRGGSSEHEATRRIKTEFLINWSDLQKAAAGRTSSTSASGAAAVEGDATRVLVLAATNTPWAIDEAARRRFVRRQYIPLPEAWVRETQIRRLLSAQKHNMSDRDITVLVHVTEGYSGSDITALAKDAAMGPLRSLGEKLLYMDKEEIRGIGMRDFENSLCTIRPSVSEKGLGEYEEWAKEFGERGG